jgi:3-deoxy-D-manno-octulosonic-acid transferase
MGHNPLEPARAGVPILTGPHIASFTELYATFFNHKAAIRVTSAKKLEKSVLALLKDPAAARQMAGRAKSLAEESAGILDYTIAKLRSLL